MPTQTKNRKSQTEAWDTAQAAVKGHAAQLRQMTSHRDIFEWAKTQNLNTKALWPRVKSELRKQLHVDYDELKRQAYVRAMVDLAAAAATADAPTITLCAAGDAEVNSYAVVNPAADDGDPWYGDFFDNDRVTDQASADVAAAKKAVFLAGKARELAELDVVRLRLIVSNHEVSAEGIASDALRWRVHVTIDISNDDNPALDQCRENGYRQWRHVSLTDLLAASEAQA